MTPKQQQNWERSEITNSPAEFIPWFPSHSSTLSWEGMPWQELTPLISLFSYGLHFPVHDTRHGETPVDGICQRVEQWNPHFNWTPLALLPKITEITGVERAGMWSQMFHSHPLFFQYQGVFPCNSSPGTLVVQWMTCPVLFIPSIVQTLAHSGDAEVPHLWHWEQRLGNSSNSGSAVLEIMGEFFLSIH